MQGSIDYGSILSRTKQFEEKGDVEQMLAAPAWMELLLYSVRPSKNRYLRTGGTKDS